MQCDDPIRVLVAGSRAKNGKIYNEDVLVPCGRCYNCKIRRLRCWLFRLRQEEKISTSAYFVTFTYSPKTIPITQNGFMTLKIKDMQTYYKRLRNTYRYKSIDQTTGKKKWLYDKVPEIKHYTVGEYGTKGSRPHYHAIIFNAHEENIVQAWSKFGDEIGNVVLGTVTEASISYTLTYMIVKSQIEKRHSRDDRQKEKSIMSKGIGKKYVTKEVIEHYRNNLSKAYILEEDNTKIAMPKYYRNMIYNDDEKVEQTKIIQKALKEIDSKDRRTEEQKRNNKIKNIQKFKQSKK